MAADSTPYNLSPLIPIPWAGVRSWLDAAERTHAATGGSTVHISRAQLLALSQLAQFVDEPAAPTDDHVSKLMRMLPSADRPASASASPPSLLPAATPMEGVRFANDRAALLPESAQGQRVGIPSFEVAEPVEVPVQGAFQLRWHCKCLLPWCNKVFPETGGARSLALFANKKEAKQYAAMEALSFLSNSNMGMPVKMPQQPPPEQSPPPQQQMSQKKQRQKKPPQELPPQQAPKPPMPQQTPQMPQMLPHQPTPPRGSRTMKSPSPETSPSASARQKRPLESAAVSSRPARRKSRSPLAQRRLAVAASSSSSPAPANAHEAAAPGSAYASSSSLSSSSSSGETAGATTTAGKRQLDNGTVAEQGRLFDTIARLGARLGIAQPQYRLSQDPARPNFFSGRAEFSVGSRVPEGIAAVEGVLGKRQARIQIAEQVLAWMTREEVLRQEMVNKLLI